MSMRDGCVAIGLKQVSCLIRFVKIENVTIFTHILVVGVGIIPIRHVYVYVTDESIFLFIRNIVN